MKNWKLKGGFAQVDITPDPKDVFLDGYGGRITPSEGILSPIYAKICAISSGEKLFVMVSLDICGMDQKLKDFIRDIIRVMTGLRDDQFSLSATHTHAGPACGVLLLPVHYPYWGYVAKLVSEGIEAAIRNQTEGAFRFGFGDEFLSHPFNRRGKGIIDRRVFVCGFFDREEKLRGVITSASCHAVCNTSMLISADYPSVMTRRATELYPDVPFLFFQGRGADIDPIKDEETAGQEFADCVFAGLERLGDPLFEGELKSCYRTVKMPMCYPSDELVETMLKAAKENLSAAQSLEESRASVVETAWCIRMTQAKEKGIEPAIEGDIAMMTVGKELAFVFLPFELLTATGNAVEKMLASYGIAAEKAFVIGYSNANNGYLAPSDEAGDSTYETEESSVWYGLPFCSADTEKMVLATVSDMAKELFE